MQIKRRDFLGGITSTTLRPSSLLPRILSETLEVTKAVPREIPHFYFLASADAIIDDLEELLSLKTIDDPSRIAAALTKNVHFFIQDYIYEDDPALSKFADDASYFEKLARSFGERDKSRHLNARFDGSLEGAQKYVQSVLRHPLLADMGDDRWHDCLAAKIRKTLIEKADALKGFDWGAFVEKQEAVWMHYYGLGAPSILRQLQSLLENDPSQSGLVAQLHHLEKFHDWKFYQDWFEDMAEEFNKDLSQISGIPSSAQFRITRDSVLDWDSASQKLYRIEIPKLAGIPPDVLAKDVRELWKDAFEDELLKVIEGNADRLLVSVKSDYAPYFEESFAKAVHGFCLNTTSRISFQRAAAAENADTSAGVGKNRSDYYGALIAPFPPPVASVLYWRNTAPEVR